MATQMPEHSAGEDVIELLMTDHREVEALFAQIESNPDAKKRERTCQVLIAELVRHSVAEEEYLYPTARKVLPNGDGIADREIREHAHIEELMKELEDLKATDARFNVLVADLKRQVTVHVEDEETNLFPQLRVNCTPEGLVELGKDARLAKKLGPTRPHPSAPDTPPWNKILGPGAGLVDRVRDVLSGRPTEADEI